MNQATTNSADSNLLGAKQLQQFKPAWRQATKKGSNNMNCSVCNKEDDFFYEINGYHICTECAQKTVQQLYDESDFPLIEMKSMVVAEKIPDVICYHDAIGAKKFHLVQDLSDYEKTIARFSRGTSFIVCQCAIEEIPEGYEDEDLIYADTDSVKNNTEQN